MWLLPLGLLLHYETSLAVLLILSNSAEARSRKPFASRKSIKYFTFKVDIPLWKSTETMEKTFSATHGVAMI